MDGVLAAEKYLLSQQSEEFGEWLSY